MKKKQKVKRKLPVTLESKHGGERVVGLKNKHLGNFKIALGDGSVVREWLSGIEPLANREGPEFDLQGLFQMNTYIHTYVCTPNSMY